MDPSGVVHTTALLERTRVQRKICVRVIDPSTFLAHFNPWQTEDQKFTEVMSVRT